MEVSSSSSTSPAVVEASPNPPKTHTQYSLIPPPTAAAIIPLAATNKPAPADEDEEIAHQGGQQLNDAHHHHHHHDSHYFSSPRLLPSSLQAPHQHQLMIEEDDQHDHEDDHHPRSSENQHKASASAAAAAGKKTIGGKGYMFLLVMNYLFLFVGSVSSSLLSKYYFIHKGSSRWVSTWVQSAGFPLLLFPIFLPYYVFKGKNKNSSASSTADRGRPFSGFNPRILTLSVLVGLMLGINNLLFSWGNSYLPVSTSSLLLSTQLVFNLILSVIIVKQKINFQNLNCVILLTLSSVLLALGSSSDRPQGLTRAKYFIGFFSTIGAGLLFALYLPVMEKIYSKVYCYEMVMEMQLIMEIAATTLALVGMASDGGFSEMRRESQEVFDKGPKVYWMTVFGNVVTWQLCFMGTAGMIFLTSSLTGGICMTALLTMNVLGGVLVYGDEFGGVKVVSTLLCTWGFCSYVYGMYLKMKKKKKEEEKKTQEDDEQQQEEMMIMLHKHKNNNNNNNKDLPAADTFEAPV